jgi:hypothetical protein
MHARSGVLYPRSDNFDYVLRFLRDTVTRAAQKEAGFKGMLVL